MAMDGSSSLRRLVEIDVEKAANHKSLYQLELGMCTDSLLLKAKQKKCPATICCWKCLEKVQTVPKSSARGEGSGSKTSQTCFNN